MCAAHSAVVERDLIEEYEVEQVPVERLEFEEEANDVVEAHVDCSTLQFLPVWSEVSSDSSEQVRFWPYLPTETCLMQHSPNVDSDTVSPHCWAYASLVSLRKLMGRLR